MNELAGRKRCVVIGTGAIGSAAAHWLSRRLGPELLVLEQFHPGHTRGASEDHSRIIRRSYDTTAYTRLTQAMFDAWHELEAETGMAFVTMNGGLDLADPSTEGSMAELELNASAMDGAGIAYERLDAAALMRRWPQWRLPADAGGIWQQEAGILDIRQACAAHLALAQGRGAQIRSGARVERLEPVGDGVLVHTDRGTVHADDVVVCAGKWTNSVLGELGPLPLHYTREQVTYFATPNLRDFHPDRFPIWIWLGEPAFYGFPVYGTAAIKAAQDLGGPRVDVDSEESPVDPSRIKPVIEFLSQHLPGAVGPIAYSRSCVYDLTPDRDFVLDALPHAPNVHVAVGAGHAAKFGGLLGRILSEQVLDGGTPLDVDAFRVDRPALGVTVGVA